MCLDAKFAVIHARHPCGHQLTVPNRPRRGASHGFVSDLLHVRSEEAGTVADQFDHFGCRLARHQANEREQRLGAEAVPLVQDRKTHAHPLLVAVSRAARAESYCRVDWPTAAHTTISKIWSSVRPDAFAMATS